MILETYINGNYYTLGSSIVFMFNLEAQNVKYVAMRLEIRLNERQIWKGDSGLFMYVLGQILRSYEVVHHVWT